MQPRTLYTSLLMLAIIGSALGHGRHIREKRSDFGPKTSAKFRAQVLEELHLLKLRSVHFDQDEEDRAKYILAWLAPDRDAFEANWDLPLEELIDFIRGYVALVPIKILDEMRDEFRYFQDDFLSFFGFFNHHD